MRKMLKRKKANVVVLSSFNNTDLDFQLRQREITEVVVAGLTANACVEATARYAYDM